MKKIKIFIIYEINQRFHKTAEVIKGGRASTLCYSLFYSLC
jgi:hypothetical protein